MRHLDLFSGIGGFALACSWVWGEEYENVGHSEVEPYACKVYHKHFPESQCLGDITKIKWQEGQADLITGGFPCQPHSVAGKRKASADERDLWSECVRALRGVRPRYALFENVPGLFVSERGRFFNRVIADLSSCGYDVEWRVLSAGAVGAHFNGGRVWIVAESTAASCGRLQGERTYPMGKSAWGRDEFERLVQLEIQHGVPAGKNGRISDGVSNRMGKLRVLGNAIVPQVARVILEQIKAHDLRSADIEVAK